MATIINNPTGTDSADTGAGIIIGVVVAIILIALFVIYGVPAIRNNGSAASNQPDTTNVNVSIPNQIPAAAPANTNK